MEAPAPLSHSFQSMFSESSRAVTTPSYFLCPISEVMHSKTIRCVCSFGVACRQIANFLLLPVFRLSWEILRWQQMASPTKLMLLDVGWIVDMTHLLWQTNHFQTVIPSLITHCVQPSKNSSGRTSCKTYLHRASSGPFLEFSFKGYIFEVKVGQLLRLM